MPLLNRYPALFVAAALLAGCDTADTANVTAAPGAPLAGLDSALLARFAAGQVLFHKEFTPEEGLGPLFNQRRCSSCHDLPTLGGSGVELVTKATRFEPATGCDLLRSEGGDVIQQRATPNLEALGVEREQVPARANAVVHVGAPPLYGLGLIEAIPEIEIRARADSADQDGDGISGRVPRTADGRAGRFGRRGEFVDLEDFIAGALLVEMGLTTTRHPAEEGVNGSPLPPGADPAADPEIDDHALGLLTDYVRLLAAPARDTFPRTARDTLARGERLFRSVGCTDCHTPMLRTGSSDIPALSHKRVPLYSDLLLHDLGDELASTCGAAASPSEFRTAPLMGLRFRPRFMHDGEDRTLERAVQIHGGEADRARRKFAGLSEVDRRALLRWLLTL